MEMVMMESQLESDFRARRCNFFTKEKQVFEYLTESLVFKPGIELKNLYNSKKSPVEKGHRMHVIYQLTCDQCGWVYT